MACLSVCKIKAISAVSDKKGFLYPVIDDNICVDCGLCALSCPAINTPSYNVKDQQYYASWNLKQDIRKNSSSGGLFYEFASFVLKNNGVVFGAKFDSDFIVRHSYVDKIEDLCQLQGSKYVQSRIENTYIQAADFLKSGRKVLFSGVPCQIAGLKSFLKKDYENLLTIDLVCHGTPSPKLFDSYKDFVKTKYRLGDFNSFNFRSKDNSWHLFNIKIVDKNRKKYYGGFYEDAWIRGFLRNIFLRESCYTCKYATINRLSDISLADYWGYSPLTDDIKHKGVSLLIVNNEKGKNVLSQLSNNLYLETKDLASALSTNMNLQRPCEKPDSSETFWSDYFTLPFENVISKWMYPEQVSHSELINSTFPRRKVFILHFKKYYYSIKIFIIKIIKAIFPSFVIDAAKRFFK